MLASHSPLAVARHALLLLQVCGSNNPALHDPNRPTFGQLAPLLHSFIGGPGNGSSGASDAISSNSGGSGGRSFDCGGSATAPSTVIVAHNGAFDARMLIGEWARRGLAVPRHWMCVPGGRRAARGCPAPPLTCWRVTLAGTTVAGALRPVTAGFQQSRAGARMDPPSLSALLPYTPFTRICLPYSHRHPHPHPHASACSLLDTLPLARACLTGCKNHKQGTLRQLFGLALPPGEADHDAGTDVTTLARLLPHLVKVRCMASSWQRKEARPRP